MTKSNSEASKLASTRKPIRRTARACDSCRLKKAKCDGARPCKTCIDNSRICTYSRNRRRDINRRQYERQGIFDKAIQRLYQACLEKDNFPGTMSSSNVGPRSTEDILVAMGLLDYNSDGNREKPRTPERLHQQQHSFARLDSHQPKMKQSPKPVSTYSSSASTATASSLENNGRVSRQQGRGASEKALSDINHDFKEAHLAEAPTGAGDIGHEFECATSDTVAVCGTTATAQHDLTTHVSNPCSVAVDVSAGLLGHKQYLPMYFDLDTPKRLQSSIGASQIPYDFWPIPPVYFSSQFVEDPTFSTPSLLSYGVHT